MSGVPQGTVLSPILFLCYINDIPDRVKSTIRLFADDCLLYRQIKSLADQIQLQQDLASLEAWAQDWGMKFNPIKCYLMSITSSKRPFTYIYTLDNHTLQQVQNSPYLGVLLSDDMKWTPQITNITKKASSTLGFFRRNLRHCSGKLKDTAYKTLVRANLEYASAAWDPYTDTHSKLLERIQRCAVCFVKGDYSRYGSVTSMLKDLNWDYTLCRGQC